MGKKEKPQRDLYFMRNSLLGATLEWWAYKCPVGWTVSQHVENPTINCVTDQEKNIAREIVEWVKLAREINPDLEEPRV